MAFLALRVVSAVFVCGLIYVLLRAILHKLTYPAQILLSKPTVAQGEKFRCKFILRPLNAGQLKRAVSDKTYVSFRLLCREATASANKNKASKTALVFERKEKVLATISDGTLTGEVSFVVPTDAGAPTKNVTGLGVDWAVTAWVSAPNLPRRRKKTTLIVAPKKDS